MLPFHVETEAHARMERPATLVPVYPDIREPFVRRRSMNVAVHHVAMEALVSTGELDMPVPVCRGIRGDFAKQR